MLRKPNNNATPKYIYLLKLGIDQKEFADFSVKYCMRIPKSHTSQTKRFVFQYMIQRVKKRGIIQSLSNL